LKIYYHVSDLDGKCSGAIVARRYPNAMIIPYNYWYDFERTFCNTDKSVDKDEELIFVDICPRADTLINLLEITKNILVIDHHDTSYEDLKSNNFPIKHVFDTNNEMGACRLVWEYFYPNIHVPEAVKLIAERDVWKRTIENDKFHFGMLSLSNFPTSRHWDKLLSDHPIVDSVKNIGKHILGYLVPWYQLLICQYGIEGTIDGHSAIFINQGGIDGTIFDSIYNKYRIHLKGVYCRDQSWHMTISTDRSNTDIDVGKIAYRYGGGGRSTVAGFKVEEISEVFLPNKK